MTGGSPPHLPALGIKGHQHHGHETITTGVFHQLIVQVGQYFGECAGCLAAAAQSAAGRSHEHGRRDTVSDHITYRDGNGGVGQ